MPANTKIQLRRGLAADWTSTNPTLAAGEIGFETNTGKFKIGTNGLTAWNDLAYAGGSNISPGSGISVIKNETTNTYTIHGTILASGSGLISTTVDYGGNGTSTVSGTYYSIGLSDRLQNFNNSNISISNNAISSSTSGISISGFNSSTIALNPGGGIVTASGIDIRNITESITVTSPVGGLSTGTVLTTASGITDILKKMLQQIFEPSITNPGFTISFPGGTPTTVEAGTVTNLTINANFTQGSVNGSGLGAGWVAGGFQGVRAGAATSYVINSSGVGTSTSLNIGNVTAVDGAITYNGSNSTVTYGTGIVPKNSTGANSALHVQLSGNTIQASNNISYTGRRKLFYGTSSSVISTPTSGNILALSNSILNPSTSTPNFNIVAPTGTRTIIIAVPSGAGYSSLANSTLTVFDTNTQQFLDVATTFSTSAVDVPGANGYLPTGYKVLTYVNGAPTIVSSTYTIDLAS
jgi:hypothetical protein